MFIMDLMKFTCGREFTRPDLAKYLFAHEFVGKMALTAKVSIKRMAVALSHEICGRLLSEGVIDLNSGVYKPINAHKFPFMMALDVRKGAGEFRFRAAMDMNSISDDELFK